MIHVMAYNYRFVYNNCMRNSKFAQERHQKIKDILFSKSPVTLRELCDIFDCSEATIRNDLAFLEKNGALKRVKGGAVSTDTMPRNSRIAARMGVNTNEKKAIARYAVDHFVEPGMIITLDSGTTNLLLAQYLVERRIPCTVITNSFPVASVIAKSSDITMYLAAGEYDPIHGSFHDESAEEVIASSRSDICFISPNGIDGLGNITNSGLSENSIKKAMIRQASKLIILADHSKIGKSELKVLCTSGSVTCVITDSGISIQQKDILEKGRFNYYIVD